MTPAELLADAFERVHDVVHRAVEGLDGSALTYRPGPRANSIAWLVWHLTRVQDDHVSHVAGVGQEWIAGDWKRRFDLPFPPAAIGYGQDPADVDAVQVDADTLLGYHDAVYARSQRFISVLSDADLDRVVDDSYDPPVTLGARLISVISDDLQHAGQAAYIRGIALNGG